MKASPKKNSDKKKKRHRSPSSNDVISVYSICLFSWERCCGPRSSVIKINTECLLIIFILVSCGRTLVVGRCKLTGGCVAQCSATYPGSQKFSKRRATKCDK